MIRNVCFFITLCFLSSCSNNSVNEGSEDTPLFQSVEAKKEKIQKKMDNFQGDQYMVYLGLRAPSEVDNIFKYFGNNLDKKGLVLKISTDDPIDKKNYLKDVQRKLGKNYEYTDSPFLIFYKRSDITEAYSPHKMLSFGNISEECLSNSLMKIERRILNDSINSELDNKLFISTIKSCKAVDYPTLKPIFELVDFFRGVYEDLT